MQLNAQQPYAIHLNNTNGLPSNSIYNVFQDSKGFMWFSTNSGLTRYDGFEYKTYLSDKQTSRAGSCIKEDKFGRIWYENFDGYIYYIENDSLKELKQNDPVGYVPIGITEKNLFLIQEKGIDVYDLKSLTIIKTIPIPIINAEHALSNNKRFYAIIDNNIYCVTENLSLITCSYFKNEKQLTKQIYSINEGVYVIYKHNEHKQLYLFDKDLRFNKTLLINEPNFIQGSSFIDNTIWIHTTKGTYSFKLNNAFVTANLSYFIDKSVSHVIKDRQNNYWFSTTDDGVYLVSNLNNKIQYLNGFLPNKLVETKTNYFIATKKGEIVNCNYNLQVKSRFNQKSDNSEIYFFLYDSLSNKLFYSSNGFSEVNTTNYSEINFYPIAIKDMIRIDSNYFAFAASGYCGLVKFHSYKFKSAWDNIFQRNINDVIPNTSSLINNVRGKSVAYVKHSNSIYYATNIGLFKYNLNHKKEIKFLNASFYANKLITYKNNLYGLSTKGNFYAIKNDTEFVCLNKRYGIKDLDIKYIKNNYNKLVVISSQNAFLIDLEKNTSRKIDINVTSYEITDVLIKEKLLLFVTSNGILSTTLNPEIKKSNAIIKINELRVNTELYNCNVSHHLHHSQNDITIKYSVLDFGSSRTNNVYYKINKSDWKLASPETRVIDFASLSPGNYIIELKLNDIVSSERIIFSIAAPFWKTTWFNVLLTTLIITIAFVYYKWQLNKLRNKNKLLQDKINLEHDLNKTVLKSIKAQMNPHFFYNALNTIQAYIFTNDKTKANSYLAKFSKLTRAILEMSEKETITLSEEIESLKLYLELEKMRFKEGFNYHINNVNIDNADLIEFPPMIIQPYVENSIKHGLLHLDDNREVSITFNLISDALQITIDDNGIGRKRSSELNKIRDSKYQSFSSEANEKRLEILNKGRSNTIAVEIIDKTNNLGASTGTKVILTIPIN